VDEVSWIPETCWPKSAGRISSDDSEHPNLYGGLDGENGPVEELNSMAVPNTSRRTTVMTMIGAASFDVDSGSLYLFKDAAY
jgi:hypothetical protein